MNTCPDMEQLTAILSEFFFLTLLCSVLSVFAVWVICTGLIELVRFIHKHLVINKAAHE